jgi:capsid protein
MTSIWMYKKDMTAISLMMISISLLFVQIDNNYAFATQQQKIIDFLITLVQNKPELGEVAVVVSFADEISTVKRDVDDKRVEVPVRLGTFSENVKHEDAEVCVTVLSNGEQVCKTIPNVSEDKVNKLTINLRQVECNSQFCLNE